LISPVVAPTGTVALICVSESSTNEASVPLNFTTVAPVRLAPVMVTVVPTGPEVGMKPETVGPVTVKLEALVAVPPGVVTPIDPVVAPLGTTVVIWVSELTVKVAAAPLNVTAEAPVRPVPPMVTLVPIAPDVGVKLEIVGGGDAVTVKLDALVAAPTEVLTLIGPVVAPLGTVAVIWASERSVKLALVPLNLTAVAPVKFAPVMATLVPTGPDIGVNPEIDGPVDVVTVKFDTLDPVPPAVTTVIGPLIAPPGTVAVICVSELTV
jgi:hypothetical protein